MASSDKDTVRVTRYQGVLLERYAFMPGPVMHLAPHLHDEYQIGLTLTDPTSYTYRGATHLVPVGSVTVIHPGELHSGKDLKAREQDVTLHAMLYLSTTTLRALLRDVWSSDSALPFVPQAVIHDADLQRRFMRLVAAAAPTTLEVQERLLAAAAALFARHGERVRTIPHDKRAPKGVERVRDYLEAHVCDSVSILDLAHVAQLSPYHLSRAFRRVYGLPPHAYHLQAKITHAKRRLLDGVSATSVAYELGFAHQSHFGRQFKRIVGVSPGRYDTKAQDLDSSAPHPSVMMPEDGR